MGAEFVTPESTWHLATSVDDTLVTAFEFAMIQAFEAFQRSVVQIQRIVGDVNIQFGEGVLLHIVRMQERPKDATTIARLMNRDDLQNVLYGLRKLGSLGLVRKVRVGATTLFEITDDGIDATDRYAKLRREIIVSGMADIVDVQERMRRTTELLHSLTGHYDTAAREVAAMDPARLFGTRDHSSRGRE
ncbi:hypothetical protein CH298_02320 [Rhodococcoides fascians]|uniref:winged helix DNA-binding protein n=1 Tax=Nocardiaceae TaxID=85025 RepID=UPI000B9B92D6|nr:MULTISPECIES: winged helix DNA-binding protein [Rhodococcus]OZD80330.1 hypothetical protein CH258_20775 [Rhodococcus sp. 05-2256-B4]OZD87392.1 hypothetical protein CH257_25440 [Rhodococcus sp. 05-2256-B3]OZD94821.1 hypothetical protein CH260_15435 [Rhodococcus sp. 05-2256-B2]OZE07926.1 hypothetical protein CH285_04185 [Rhodococcus sp. 05-2256-B1]OZE92398.1 hypothetical protein CH303_02320 [Rhodococcus fascians]